MHSFLIPFCFCYSESNVYYFDVGYCTVANMAKIVQKLPQFAFEMDQVIIQRGEFFQFVSEVMMH
jgi:hypothetical protein